ncbi:hypothetical protein TWF718_008936 [Orbilia javanica]|uniref:UBR-type domain-containing protein n=1 Tax=Orbilia javanica TaxID=47235 RepID=A0AAN8RGL2_9PEZI
MLKFAPAIGHHSCSVHTTFHRHSLQPLLCGPIRGQGLGIGTMESGIENPPEAVGVSQTAQDYIDAQRQLEIEAREILPYSFDTCTKPLGPLRQLVFACMKCTSDGSSPAGICYSCSISCHGSHGELVELFSKRNFECDCGTTRMPGSHCHLRKTQEDSAAQGNSYNQNFQNLFCKSERYEVENELGTMYQCLLGDRCGEDWFHDRCILGLPPGGPADSDAGGSDHLQGFPDEDSFEYFICWKCTSANPWLLKYAGTPGFLEPVVCREDIIACSPSQSAVTVSKKRKASAISSDDSGAGANSESANHTSGSLVVSQGPIGVKANLTEPCKLLQREYPGLADKKVSLFLRSDFRDHLCHCTSCLEKIGNHKCLLEEEVTHEPPLDSDAGESEGHSSLLDAGEKALGTIDRIRAIEGVMAYNTLKEKVKEFLQPFAEGKRVVCQEDVKKYFEELKGGSKATEGDEVSRK